DFWASGVVLAGIVAGSVLTFAYSARFWWGAFAAPRAVVLADAAAPVRPPAAAFVAPPVVLALASLVLGLAPGALDDLMDAAASSLDRAAESVHLALWHGVNTALVLSAVTIAAGVALFLVRRRVGRVIALGARIPSGDDGY